MVGSAELRKREHEKQKQKQQKKKGRKAGGKCLSLSRPPHSLGSSPLSESLEQANKT